MEKRNYKEATLFAFASIIFVEQIFRVLQGNMDVLILGRVSHDAVAAVGVINQLMAICLVIISIGSIGTNILLAQYTGERNDQNITLSLFSGLKMTIWLAAILFVAIFFFHPFFLRWMGLTDILIRYGSIYTKIVSFSLFLHAFNMIFLVYFRNMQLKKVIIGTLFFATIFNLTGTLICLSFFDSTESIIAAVASLTVFAHLITFVIYGYELRVKRKISFSFMTHRSYVKEIARTGVPSALEHFSYILFQLLLSWVIISWGKDQLTAKTYLQAWTEFIFLFSVTIGQATQILVGQKIGQNKTNELPAIVQRSMRLNIIITLVGSLILFLLSRKLFFFFDIHVQIATYIFYLLLLTLVLEPLRAINVNLVSSLYAIRDTRFPMIVSLVSLWFILAPLVLFFQAYMHIIVVWVLLILDELLRSIFLYRRWKAQASRMTKQPTDLAG